MNLYFSYLVFASLSSEKFYAILPDIRYKYLSLIIIIFLFTVMHLLYPKRSTLYVLYM